MKKRCRWSPQYLRTFHFRISDNIDIFKLLCLEFLHSHYFINIFTIVATDSVLKEKKYTEIKRWYFFLIIFKTFIVFITFFRFYRIFYNLQLIIYSMSFQFDLFFTFFVIENCIELFSSSFLVLFPYCMYFFFNIYFSKNIILLINLLLSWIFIIFCSSLLLCYSRFEKCVVFVWNMNIKYYNLFCFFFFFENGKMKDCQR